MHATNTSAGILTIRASQKQNSLLEEYDSHYDNHTKAYFALMVVNRWFGMRLDAIVVFYTVFIVFACIIAKGRIVCRIELGTGSKNFEMGKTDYPQFILYRF